MRNKRTLDRPIIFFDDSLIGVSFRNSSILESELVPRWNLALWKMPERIIASADWNDSEGIKNLVNVMQDPESVLAMMSLMDPHKMASETVFNELEKSVAPFTPVSKEALNKILNAVPFGWERDKTKKFSGAKGFTFSSANFGVVLLGNRIIALRTEVPSFEGFKRFTDASRLPSNKYIDIWFDFLARFDKLLISAGFKKKIEHIFSDIEKTLFAGYLKNEGQAEWLQAYCKAIKEAGMHFVPNFGPMYLNIWATNLPEEEWAKVAESQDAVSYRFLSSKAVA